MVSLKKQKGFTLVELLIVIIIIGILATLVIVTFTGIQAKARDSKRQTDIEAVDTQVEAYYAENAYYPSLANLQSKTWVQANLKGLDVSALLDPKAAAPTGDNTGIVGTATATAYGYAVTPSGCDNTGTNLCTGFTLTADLESGGTFTKQSNT
ncbi:MAG TPA: prepilin-type N-terminal cleavage/methylation domain-containing protein [Candidatus Saccharimonadales bacterium]|nr:prepilin-type N-terminal cleavage/methylation domain-containing protein [Candidatus Saccharimonadales bacterium]